MATSNNSTAHIPQVVPNLMPCEISPCETTITKQLWTPVVSSDDSGPGSREVTAYFRGRRLVGKEIDLPEGFTGFVPEPKIRKESVADVEDRIDREMDGDDDQCDENQTVPLPRLEAKYKFDKIRIFGHEEQPSSDLPHMRAMQGWTKMASAMHQRT